MSNSEKVAKKKSTKSPPKNQLTGWIIRGVVFGVLGLLLILAVLDFQAKQAATGTAAAWRGAVQKQDETSDLRKSEFDKIPLQGNPSTTSAKAEANSYAAVTVNTYTWKGTFRSYVVKVYVGMGNDPSIEHIEGP